MSWNGSSKGSVAGYKIFVFILQTLGLKTAYFVLRFIVLWYCFFSRKSTASLYKFYRQILGYGFFRTCRFIYRNYYVFGQTLIDKVAILGGLGDKFSIDHEGNSFLKKIAADKTGAILISAHIGNYEIAGNLLKNYEIPVNIVMYDGEHEKIKDYLSSVYGKKKINIIPIKNNDMSHIFEINNALGRNEVICIHGDRYVEGNKVLKFNFLGREAVFPVGPFLLVHKLKVPYSFVFAAKDTATHYHFFASPPKIADGTIGDLVGEYVSTVEKMVHRYPEQWFNFYDFWKQPNTNGQ
jgi:predicted LPLAT superfamily acyltransferase